MKKLLALLLALAMIAALFVGCSKTGTDQTDAPDVSDNTDNVDDTTAPDDTTTPDTPSDSDTPLVVGYSPFSSKFSPFFSETAYDQDVYAMTSVSLLTSDRTGVIILNGIEGETIDYNGTPYTYYGPANLVITENEDGTVYYDFTLREDITFSDGTPMTIDDVIFSMYVLCDPTYEGNSTLFAQPIEGMDAYRSGMDSRGNAIFAAGNEGYTENDLYTEDQYNAFWDYYNNNAGADFAQSIIDYCMSEYGSDAYIQAYYNPDLTYADVSADESLQVGYGMAMWGFGDAWFEGATAADYWDAIVEAYEGDTAAAEAAEAATGDRCALTITALGDEYVAGVQTGESAANISGIQKTGDYSMRIVMTQIDAVAIYQLGVVIAPMHYYGNADIYDYDNNCFGFPKGDLSSVRAKTTVPMGAGPYKFVEFTNGTVYFERNDSYFLGTPKTKYINFTETLTDDDKLNGITTGTIDLSDPAINIDAAATITDTNGGEGLVGSVLTTNLVDNLGYGYIGMNANVMSVGGEAGSDASKNLRKAFGTILSVYRDVAIDSYYGELAEVINYPISNTSWAAPRPSDDGYEVAFSKDVDGNPIYTSDMTAEEKYAAAQAAALGFFEAAGYTVEDGKITAAPAGASTEYELWIPADGKGDHPSFMICTLAKEALAEIGMNLIVKDLTNSSDLWTALEAETVAMWAAAWGATVDPDMYQIYYSDVANATDNKGGPAQGGSNYMYRIADAELDQLIMDARASTDQVYRKAMYKACLDTIIDWAVEIPVYQRQNAIVFSTERVNMSTVTPDITTFYGWLSEVDKIELN